MTTTTDNVTGVEGRESTSPRTPAPCASSPRHPRSAPVVPCARRLAGCHHRHVSRICRFPLEIRNSINCSPAGGALDSVVAVNMRNSSKVPPTPGALGRIGKDWEGLGSLRKPTEGFRTSKFSDTAEVLNRERWVVGRRLSFEISPNEAIFLGFPGGACNIRAFALTRSNKAR